MDYGVVHIGRPGSLTCPGPGSVPVLSTGPGCSQWQCRLYVHVFINTRALV